MNRISSIRGQTIFMSPAVSIAAAIVLPPLLYVIYTSVNGPALSLTAFSDVLTSRLFRQTLSNTIGIAASASVLTLVLGVDGIRSAKRVDVSPTSYSLDLFRIFSTLPVCNGATLVATGHSRCGGSTFQKPMAVSGLSVCRRWRTHDRPKRGARGVERRLRGRLPRVLLRLPTGRNPHMALDAFAYSDHEATRELGARCRHSQLLRLGRPRVAANEQRFGEIELLLEEDVEWALYAQSICSPFSAPATARAPCSR